MFKKIIFLTLIIVCNTAEVSFAQKKVIRILDSESKPIQGQATGRSVQANTDQNGFILLTSADTYTITAKGFRTQVIDFQSLLADTNNIVLQALNVALSEITFSGSRFKKRVAEEVVSISVLKPEFIRNAAINRMDEALNKLPGVDVVENQINIRGGSGWSYGAGSRVLVLVDDMPILSADAQDAKWDFIPLESIAQVEVLKGAASALYGSSALNGVVHFRTAFAKNKPETRVQLFSGAYSAPKIKDMKWWDDDIPMNTGGYFSHSRKYKKTEILLGSAWMYENSYLQGDITRRGRVNFVLRHKLTDKVTLGLSANIQKARTRTFFLHTPDTTFTKFLQPYGGLEDSTTTLNSNRGTRMNIDPSIVYVGDNGVTHSLRTRALLTQNLIPEKDQTSIAWLGYANYQMMKKFQEQSGWKKDLVAIAGVAGSLSDVRGELYQDRKANNFAIYTQLEKKVLEPMWISVGARIESNQMDTITRETKPIFRAGMNYRVSEFTFLRASWGQGYRYPTIAERYIKTSFGAASVFPNPGLASETGQSSEIGLRQGLKLGAWTGMLDAAAFWMRYYNMIEFNFGYSYPTEPGADSSLLKNLGFKSLNIGNTDIKGLDISIAGGKQGIVPQNIMMGYTYLLPTQMDMDSAKWANYSTDENFLKYRYRHSIKLNYGGEYKKMQWGMINTLTSPMVNIDEVFENSKPSQNIYGLLFDIGTGLPKGIKKFRDQHNKWVLISDLRIGYKLTKGTRVAIVVKNAGNALYYARPALIGAPRSYNIQLFSDF